MSHIDRLDMSRTILGVAAHHRRLVDLGFPDRLVIRTARKLRLSTGVPHGHEPGSDLRVLIPGRFL